MLKGIRFSVVLLLALFFLICVPQAGARTHFSISVGRPAYVYPYPVYTYPSYSYRYDYPSYYSSYYTYSYPAYTYSYSYPSYTVRVHRKHKHWKTERRERERYYYWR